MTAGAGAEFSRPFRLSQLGPEPCEMSFSPGPEECRALARRFDLVAISQFDCTASIRALADDGQYELTGRFVARLQQACVVTLEPVDARLEESFRLRLQRLEPAVEDASRPEPASRKAELIFDADEDDVEPVIGEDVDLGEIFAQYLCLALDPYPRKPGAALAGDDVVDPPRRARANPFTILRELKDGA